MPQKCVRGGRSGMGQSAPRWTNRGEALAKSPCAGGAERSLSAPSSREKSVTAPNYAKAEQNGIEPTCAISRITGSNHTTKGKNERWNPQTDQMATPPPRQAPGVCKGRGRPGRPHNQDRHAGVCREVRSKTGLDFAGVIA